MEKKTVVELRAILKENGLPTTGVKSELIARIKENNLDPTADTKAKKASRKADDEKATEPIPAKKAKIAHGEWQRDGTLLILTPPELEGKGNAAIVSFDMDDTLITTKSGKVFANGKDDWKWLYDKIPSKLREIHTVEKKKLVIFTNQGGINGKKGYDKSKEASILSKIEKILESLPGIPVQVFVATTDDSFKKPSTGMWDVMVKNHNGNVVPDLSQCIFVGDAAGRPASPARHRGKKDFSCSDRKFARNIGISFATPEEFFMGEKVAEFDWDSADPAEYPEDSAAEEAAAEAAIGKQKQEIVVLVGFPASGKSTFCERHLVPRGYVRVNRDTLKTQEKCMKAAQAALSSGKSVVIDNTSPSIESRKMYVDLGKKVGVPVRCFRFDADEKLAVHLNYLRERITNGASPHVPTIGYCTYKKKLEEPTTAEGFVDIVHIKFIAKFDSDDAKKSFNLLH